MIVLGRRSARRRRATDQIMGWACLAAVLIAVALPAVIAGTVGGKYSVEVSESPRARLTTGAAP